MSAIDFLLAGPLSAMTVGGIAYPGLGAFCARFWLDEKWPVVDATKQPPVTLLRPVKPGVPALREKLDALMQAMRPGDQLVLGADEGSHELAICEAAAAAGGDVAVVACRAGAAVNPKISKLVQMDSQARHEHLILSDSEAQIDAPWLDAFRNEWEASDADVLTAPYRFTGLATAPQRADAAATLLGLWPGLALVRAMGQVQFTLGACTGLRRADLESVGGWAAFSEFLAEDNRLGAALAERGLRIRLSSQVATLDSDPLTWDDFWRHQRRLAVTYRVCDPRGFAGMLVTHGTTAGLAMLLLAPFSAAPGFWILWALATLLLRWGAIHLLARTLRFFIPALWRALIPAGLAETASWVLSWFAPEVWWAGSRWKVSAEGRMRLDSSEAAGVSRDGGARS